MVCRNQPAEEEPFGHHPHKPIGFCRCKKQYGNQEGRGFAHCVLGAASQMPISGGGSLYPFHAQIYMHMRYKLIPRRSHPQGIVQLLQTPDSLVESSGLSECGISSAVCLIEKLLLHLNR